LIALEQPAKSLHIGAFDLFEQLHICYLLFHCSIKDTTCRE
jgi:hypothetical protein